MSQSAPSTLLGPSKAARRWAEGLCLSTFDQELRVHAPRAIPGGVGGPEHRSRCDAEQEPFQVSWGGVELTPDVYHVSQHAGAGKVKSGFGYGSKRLKSDF